MCLPIHQKSQSAFPSRPLLQVRNEKTLHHPHTLDSSDLFHLFFTHFRLRKILSVQVHL